MAISKIPRPISNRKNKIPVSLRSFRDERKYEKVKRKRNDSAPLLVEPSIKEWTYWKLINNAFPYSAVFKIHHMLVPKRIASQNELTNPEKEELDQILLKLSNEYDCQLINFTKKQSIKDHFHIHMLTYKDKRSELKN